VKRSTLTGSKKPQQSISGAVVAATYRFASLRLPSTYPMPNRAVSAWNQYRLLKWTGDRGWREHRGCL